MRIAYLTQPYPPMISGVAIVTKQLAEAMAERGHQVLVIAASDKERPYQIYTDRMTILRLRSFNNPLRVGQRFTIHSRNAILYALRKFQPDIIHVPEPVQMGRMGLKYASHTHIPVIVTLHQLPWFVASYLPKRLRPLAEKNLWIHASWLLRKYSAITVPTKTIATVVKQMTGLKPKIISNGLNLQKFHPPLSRDDETATRRKWNLPSHIPLLLHVGRLDTDKCVDHVIRSVAPALRESDAHLLIVGDGYCKNQLIRLSRELGTAHKIHFTGYASPSDLPEIYRMANIFVTASEIETQGIVLLEAAASELPIVAVNATCIPEIVHDRINGFLIDPGDTNAFSSVITSLINNPKMAKTMGKAGRVIAEEHASHRTWYLHEQLYLEAIKQIGAQQITLQRESQLQ